MEELKIFDAGRAMLEDYLQGYPAQLTVVDAQPLQEALAAGLVAPDTRLLTFEHNQILYVFPMSVVLSYNVIQGQIGEQPWMMTFCNACNTGMVFDPVVSGQTLHFQRRGSYDGLLLIWDKETNSYWQHVSGQCLHGASQGKQLRTITPTRHMTVSEASAHPQSLLLTSTLTAEQEKLSRAMERMRANPEKVESGIIASLGEEDTRRPRFELGLGVWSQNSSCYFPLEMLYRHDSALITEFDGRPLLIYQHPEAVAPVAVYLSAQKASWQREVLRVDNGAYIQNDLYFPADGSSQVLERPMQLLMRWYGFALTFPGCRVPTL